MAAFRFRFGNEIVLTEETHPGPGYRKQSKCSSEDHLQRPGLRQGLGAPRTALSLWATRSNEGPGQTAASHTPAAPQEETAGNHQHDKNRCEELAGRSQVPHRWLRAGGGLAKEVWLRPPHLVTAM